MDQFKVGDVVQLKSGGPKMTVSGKSALTERIHCQWFEGTKLKDGDFPAESLQEPKIVTARVASRIRK